MKPRRDPGAARQDRESEKEYLIKIELPNVKKEDVKIVVADSMITISGERKLEREDQDENAIRIASVYGAFALPDYADANGSHAEAKDGVLRTHVPKTKTKKSEPVAIEVLNQHAKRASGTVRQEAQARAF